MKRRKLKKKINLFKKIVFTMLIMFMTGFVMFATAYNKRILPAVIEISKLNAITKINSVISDSVGKAISDKELETEDFYYKTTNADGRIQSLTVNSMLVDSLCSTLAVEISSELSSLEKEKIKIPIGAITGFSSMANLGPSYTARIQPLGAATVDYSTNFESVGINQINFQIWLQVEARLLVVNPLQSHDILVERKVLLLDTVFAGEVPSGIWKQ